jgi:hypothetical protein
MQTVSDMDEAHAAALQRLRERTERLSEHAYCRTNAAIAEDDEETAARWMGVFDRVGRGLRLTIAMESRMARQRRREADALHREIAAAPRIRQPQPSRERERDPAESERESEGESLPADAPVAEQIGRLQAIVERAGEPSAARRIMRGLPDVPVEAPARAAPTVAGRRPASHHSPRRASG